MISTWHLSALQMSLKKMMYVFMMIKPRLGYPFFFCLIIIKVPECYWCDGSELNGLISGDGSPFILFCRHSLSNIENYSLFSPLCRHSISKIENYSLFSPLCSHSLSNLEDYSLFSPPCRHFSSLQAFS